MGIEALYRKPHLSCRHPAHQVYPYLLRDLKISRPNHVWAADITYIPLARGFVYLFAVLDWASRRVLAWRLSNTLTTDFCLRPSGTPWPTMARRTSSIPIKGANLRAKSSRGCSRTTAFRSAWTERLLAG
ncbi:MAG: DDE-type integrase/transposase/recombinase [Nitrospira sp.]|nr:DDE-type integrase/transposase/recombinase [Nitrospira sp.]